MVKFVLLSATANASKTVGMHVRESEDTSERTSLGEVTNELALILSARRGDSEAFASLFRQHRPRIFQVVHRYYAPGWGRDDLIQEATIGFFKAIRDYKDDRGAFTGFVDLCVRRQIITFIKTATRQKHAALNRAASLDAPIFADSDETILTRLVGHRDRLPEDDSENTEFLAALWKRCSELERGILSMYSNGYTFEEMAWELGVHEKAIDNAVWRVKVKARKLLLEKPLQLS